jgi:4-diphosphocytidyl-2-C-methyl-D-erythritol kinase
VEPLRLRAPAKINLGLRVTGRRADGLHELDSLFLPLDLADEVEITVDPTRGPEVVLELAGEAAGVPADASNLAAGAARAFLDAAGLRSCVRIHLTKRIPAAAGLGGGSSDAGAVLRGLDRHFPGALGRDVLERLALGLGADVPFFLDPRPARVAGVGERIEPCTGPDPLAVLLANPGTPLATVDVYAAFDALCPSPPLRPAVAADAPWSERLRNDLEPAAVRLCPALARLRRQLQDLDPLAVALSGSGPTLYALFEDAGAARAARARGGLTRARWTRVAVTTRSG